MSPLVIYCIRYKDYTTRVSNENIPQHKTKNIIIIIHNIQPRTSTYNPNRKQSRITNFQSVLCNSQTNPSARHISRAYTENGKCKNEINTKEGERKRSVVIVKNDLRLFVVQINYERKLLLV